MLAGKKWGNTEFPSSGPSGIKLNRKRLKLIKINRYNNSSIVTQAIVEKSFFAKILRTSEPPRPNNRFINGPANAT